MQGPKSVKSARWVCQRSMVERVYIMISATYILTAQRWHMVKESPMASGPDPLNPVLSESQVAKTVKTSIKVMNISIPKTCPFDTPSLGPGVHSPLFVLLADSPLRTPAPVIAPTVCTTTYNIVLREQIHNNEIIKGSILSSTV